MPRIILSFILLLLLSAAGVAIYLWLHRDRPTAAPDLTLLNESVQRSIESELSTPWLTVNLVELTVRPQDLDSEIERIKNLATKLEGNATVNHLAAESGQDLLVEIPQASARQFIEAVQDRTKILPKAPPNSGLKNQVIEVKLHTAK
ncbi:MAG: hypothetical protein WB696_01240 [Chthoniobacterales bacterium]